MTTRSGAISGWEHVIRPEHDAVAALLGEALVGVERRFDAQLQTDLPPVRTLVEHVERYRGKMLRPAMTALWGLAAAGPGAGREAITPQHEVVGAVIEMIHLATLVHDDVLDEAETRRGGETVNRLVGNEAAVILGDYLISSAFHLCSQLDTQRVALLIGEITTRVCEGELLQLHHRDDFSVDEPTYYEIVERKTAALIGAACELGAWMSGAGEGLRDAARAYGVKLGVAFQIQDDLLDLLGEARVVGKPVGKDLEKGKLTLPLIHHLAAASPTTRGRTLDLLRRAAAGEAVGGSLVSAMEATGSVGYARDAARSLVGEARALLAAAEDGPAVSLLHAAAEGVVTRRY